MARVEVDTATGAQFTVVEEGDPDDLLLANPVASPTAEPQGEPPAESVPAPKAATTVRATRRAEPAVKVQVISPVAAAPAEPELTDEEADELEKQLDEMIAAEVAKQVDARVKEATSAVQGAKDREIASRDTRLATIEAELKTLREKELEAQISSLDPEERALFLDKRALEEEKTRLLALADEIDGVYKGQLITALIAEYGDFGITVDDIKDIDDPDEMEAYCERAKSIYEKILARTGAVVQTAPVVVATAPTRQVPAGATAPTDIGGESPALGPERKPAEGTGLDFAAQTLESLPWETVRI